MQASPYHLLGATMRLAKTVALASSASLALSACGHERAQLPEPAYNKATSIVEVGRFTLSGEDVGLWEDLESTFRPAFAVSSAQALASVSAASQSSVSQDNHTFSAGVNLTAAGPAINNTSQVISNNTGGATGNTTSTTVTNADGTTSTTGTATQGTSSTTSQQNNSSRGASQQTPAIPTAPTPLAPAAQSASTLATPGIPPVSAYSAADSLLAFQNLLNLGHKFHRFGYEAHVLLLKVGIQVSKNRLPYDAYIDVSFLGDDGDATPSPGVGQVPYMLHPSADAHIGENIEAAGGALTSDNAKASAGAPKGQQEAVQPAPDPAASPEIKPVYVLTFAETSGENLQQDVAAQAAQQLSATVGASAGAIAAAGNVQDLVSALNHSSAIRPNSLVNVGADGPNNISIKLGANRFGDEYELESFSHDVAVIVLVPVGTDPRQVNAIARVTYLNPTGGEYPDLTMDSAAIDSRNTAIRRIARTIDDAFIVDQTSAGDDAPPSPTPFADCASYNPEPDSAGDQTSLKCRSIFKLASLIGGNRPTEYYRYTDQLKITRPLSKALYGYLIRYSPTPGLSLAAIDLLPTEFLCPAADLTPFIIDNGDNATVNFQAGRGFKFRTVRADVQIPGSTFKIETTAANGLDVVGPLAFPSFKSLLGTAPNAGTTQLALSVDGALCGPYTAYYLPPKPTDKAAAASTKPAVSVTVPGSFTFLGGQGSFTMTATLDAKQADSFTVNSAQAELVSVGPNTLNSDGAVSVSAAGVMPVVMKGVFDKQSIKLQIQPMKSGKPVGKLISKTIVAHSQGSGALAAQSH